MKLEQKENINDFTKQTMKITYFLLMLKALNIIADQCINILLLNRCRTYNSYRKKSNDNITLEEYNLLRRVLWNYPARNK